MNELEAELIKIGLGAWIGDALKSVLKNLLKGIAIILIMNWVFDASVSFNIKTIAGATLLGFLFLSPKKIIIQKD